MSDTTVSDGRSDEKIVLCRDLHDLGRRAAIGFLQSAVEAIPRQGRFSVALSGGDTPRPLYQSLASPDLAMKIPWKRIHLFWGDERAVPPDHPDSNYRTAYETLIAHVPIPPENVHRMPGEKSDLQAAACEYEEILRRFFGGPPGEWPVFDLIFLGIGSDGHTASLFPGSPALNEKERWVVAVPAEKVRSARLTLTLPVLNQARQIVFLAAGKEKAPVVRALLSRNRSRIDLPAGRVRPQNGREIFFLDQAAAGPAERRASKREREEIR